MFSSTRWMLRLCSSYTAMAGRAGKAQETLRPLPTWAQYFGISTSATASNKEKSKDVDLAENPYFEKYKKRIQEKQESDPDEFAERLKSLSQQNNPQKADKESTEKTQAKVTPQTVLPSDVAKEGAGMTKQKGLNAVMKLDLIKDKTVEEITQIWNQYHCGKDCVYAVLQKSEFENLMEKSKECPVFVYPLPRDDGFEFILSQFDRNDVYFTPLSMFQLVKESAPPCLTVNHYTELMNEKGIVLMAGQYDDKLLKQQLALSLVQQMSIFYGKGSKFYDIVRKFNYQPETFEYKELIDVLQSLPQYDLR